MTPVQEKSLPLTLSGEDVIVQAKTGSGKTLSFGIPLVLNIDVKKFRIQKIVLTPTRELAAQVALELRKVARYEHNIKILELCGGVAYKPQVASLAHHAHVIVGTPGRILKHLKEGNFSCDDINLLVLDEADRMLDMGFNEDIMEIESYLPKQRQTFLFSATYEDDISSISNTILNKPKFIEVISTEKKPDIKQSFYKMENQIKTSVIPTIISNVKPQSALIFCNQKITCDSLSDELLDLGFDVLTLHSNLEQKDRDEVLLMFSNKSYPILIATDVAARGLDIDDITLVINYDMAKDENIHTHRIGRTARAGKSGKVVNFCTQEDCEQFDLEDKVEDYKILEDDPSFKMDSPFRTIYINGGKKNKVRPGDILGALTATIGLKKEQVGKINTFTFCSYVAVAKEVEQKALEGLNKNRIKGKFYRAYGR